MDKRKKKRKPTLEEFYHETPSKQTGEQVHPLNPEELRKRGEVTLSNEDLRYTPEGNLKPRDRALKRELYPCYDLDSAFRSAASAWTREAGEVTKKR